MRHATMNGKEIDITKRQDFETEKILDNLFDSLEDGLTVEEKKQGLTSRGIHVWED